MRPPLRLDLSFGDAFFAARAWVQSPSADQFREEIEADFAPRSLACLSVRTGLDLCLTALDLPAGSEVLVSAYTIPDMVRVLEHHGLRPVPVDLELDTLAPTVEALEAACSERTRAILVAHLFGSRIDLDPIADLAERCGLILFEDGAQVFGLPGYRGHERADVSLFSFGTIKTRTALGGALLRFRDAGLLARVRELEGRLPEWPRGAFARKVAKAFAMKCLSWPLPYALCIALCRLRGKDHEDVLHRSVRGFHGSLVHAIRHRPNGPLLALLARRLRQNGDERVAWRERNARAVLVHLPPGLRAVGSRAPDHTHWVTTVLADEPEARIRELRARGFDATQAATATAIVVEGRDAPRNALRLRDGLVYLPCDADYRDAELASLRAALWAPYSSEKSRLSTA